MNIQQNPGRILTTHVGSLPRPDDLLDLMATKVSGVGFQPAVYDERVKQAVTDCVTKQAAIKVVDEMEARGFLARELLADGRADAVVRSRGW